MERTDIFLTPLATGIDALQKIIATSADGICGREIGRLRPSRYERAAGCIDRDRRANSTADSAPAAQVGRINERGSCRINLADERAAGAAGLKGSGGCRKNNGGRRCG